jgi:hypothetical protein
MGLSAVDSTVLALLVNQAPAGLSRRVPPPIVIGARPAARPPMRAARGLGLELAIADITRDPSDAIVNPVGAGLVDLAVQKAAGPFLLEDFHRGVMPPPVW